MKNAAAASVAAAVCGLVAVSGLGCSSGAREVAPPRTLALTERGPGVGVETLYWVLNDPISGDPAVGPGLSIRDALRPYVTDASPVGDETAALLRQNGLRLVFVPVEAVQRLRAQLRIVGPIQQEWLGEAPRWTPLSRGPEWTAPQSLSLDNGVVTFEPGSLRMLIRTWLAPGPDTGGAFYAAQLQFEAAPQFVASRTQRSLEKALLAPTISGGADQDGQVLSRLTARLTLDGSKALLIVPEDPAVRWESEAPASESAGIAANEGGEPPAGPIGPQPPMLTTVGEAMLTDATASRRRSMRVVIVIVPSVPPRFTLSGP